jgi:hypothetical protein
MPVVAVSIGLIILLIVIRILFCEAMALEDRLSDERRILLVLLIIVQCGLVAKLEPTTTAQFAKLAPIVTVAGKVIYIIPSLDKPFVMFIVKVYDV